MFLLILVLITHSFFCFFTLHFFRPPAKTKTFRQMIFNSGFLFFIFFMSSNERWQRRRRKCISIRPCKLNRHHAFAGFFPQRVGDEWHMDVRPSSRESFKPLKSKNTEHFSKVSPYAVISTLLIFNSGLWLLQYKGVADTFCIGSRWWRMLKAKPFIDYQSVITICSIVASRDVQIPRLNKQTTNNSFQTAVAGIGSVVDRSLCECSVCVSRFTVLAWLLVRAGWKPQRRPRGSRLGAPNTKTRKHNSFFFGGGGTLSHRKCH